MKKSIVGKPYDYLKAIVHDVAKLYMDKEPVTGVGIGQEISPRGKRRFVFKIFLLREPTEAEKKYLHHSYRRIPIKYEVTGRLVAL